MPSAEAAGPPAAAVAVLYNASGREACYELPEDVNYDGIWDYQWCTERLPQETIRLLRWLIQKQALGEDVFLLGPPGPARCWSRCRRPARRCTSPSGSSRPGVQGWASTRPGRSPPASRSSLCRTS